MKIGLTFLFSALLLGCGSELPPARQDATVSDADASDVSVSDTPVDALPDASVPGDTNPLHDMDSH